MSRRKSEIDFGQVCGPTLGLVMREAARRASVAINGVKFKAHARVKGVKGNGSADYFTQADTAAQKAIVRLLRKNFPTFGIVAEEADKKTKLPLRIECRRDKHGGHDLWFVIDPLDGTSAFIREQSHGIGSMVALVCDGVVIAAYVLDVNTGEAYGFRPGSRSTYRITGAGTPRRLAIKPDRPLAGQYLLLRDPPEDHGSPAVVALARRGGPFKQYTMAEGSIGISMARLWKGEVGAAVMKSGVNTPWDWAPVYGISRRLGFRFFSIVDTTDFAGFVPFAPEMSKEVEPVLHPLLVVHESRLDELEAWIDATYGSGVTLRR